MAAAEAPREKSLAKSIRAQERESYDLAGQGASQVEALCAASFGTPVDAQSPFRVTFIVGGGKKVRTGYGGPDGLVREVCAALEKLGFTEDRSASLGQQGVFKYQHDTDKDLKFVHVFPRVNTTGPGDAGTGEAPEGQATTPVAPAELVLTCTLEALQKHVPRRCVSFAQKQALLGHLKGAASTVAACEAKLARLDTPSADEQRVFDTAVALQEKITWVQQQMEAQVEAGQLTKIEQEAVLAQLAAKLSDADAAIAAAAAEGKSARVEKLQAARTSLAAKRDAVTALKPVTHPVKYEKELRQLKAQLGELEKIESSRGLQTLDTIKKLRDKPVIEQQIEDIYAANRGWFEDPELFDKRMRAASKPAAAAAAKPAAGGGGASSAGGFVTPKATASKAKASTGKTATSNPWAALGGA